ncbi:hypothetical protein LJD39_25835, partial [Escherichia coli]|nr:hypothetical protein [Escherichia coli]
AVAGAFFFFFFFFFFVFFFFFFFFFSGTWSGGNKINYSACSWYKSSVAMDHFIGGKSGGSIYYKPIQCPTGYIMTGTRMYGIGDGVDEEHVDAYCCPFN